MRAPAERSSVSVYETVNAAAERHAAVNLGQGVLDAAPPRVAVEAVTRAILSGANHYTASPGLSELRRQAADSGHLTGVYDPATEVTIFAGATEALTTAVVAHRSSDTRLLAFEPYYDYYPLIADIAGVPFRGVPLIDDGRRFRFDAVDLAKRVRCGDILILNTPHNPTGTVFSSGELRALADVAVDADLLVVADEVYEWFTYGVEHTSIATMPGMRERTVVVSSASKTMNVTGWRVGWAMADEPRSRRMRSLHRCLSFCAPAPLQHGVLEGLRWLREGSHVRDLRARFGARRDRFAASLRECGFDPIVPEGTFFLLARTDQWRPTDALEFCLELASNARVAGLPLSTYFSAPELARRFIRFSFGRSEEELDVAAARLREFASSGQHSGATAPAPARSGERVIP